MLRLLHMTIRVVWHQGSTAFPSGELSGWYATEDAARLAGETWKRDAEHAEGGILTGDRGGIFRFELRYYEERFTDAGAALDNSNYTQTIRVVGTTVDTHMTIWRHVAIRPDHLATQTVRYLDSQHQCVTKADWPAYAARIDLMPTVRPRTRRTATTGQEQS